MPFGSFRALAALALVSAAAPALAAPTGLQSRVDSIAAHYAATPIAGMTIAIHRDGKLLLAKGYGLANREARVAADAGTVYEIGSITKQVTAAAVMLLVEQGKLSLDEPIVRTFPKLAGRADGVTVRHLLAHQSGLASKPPFADLSAPHTIAEVIDFLAAQPAESKPGERYRYNNNGYMLLGALIEQRSGQSYSSFIKRHLFDRARMAKTGFCPAKRKDTAARGYVPPVRDGQDFVPFASHHPTASGAAGALCSTVGDLARWQHALASGKLISAKSYAAMAAARPLTSGKPSSYGFGMFHEEVGGELHLYHGGASSGFFSQMGYYPGDHIGIIILANSLYSGALIEQMEAELRAATLGRDLPSRVDRPLANSELRAWAGRYALGPTEVAVFPHGTHLRAQPPGQVAARLLYQGEGRFVAEHDPQLELRFGTAQGKTRLIISSKGKALPPAEKVVD